ncbi:MAG: serine hydrolase [Candidatus Dojkabacteria bacterium]|nr:serine hydrolase [Candidatus Dojkabacteria bacterium]
MHNINDKTLFDVQKIDKNSINNSLLENDQNFSYLLLFKKSILLFLIVYIVIFVFSFVLINNYSFQSNKEKVNKFLQRVHVKSYEYVYTYQRRENINEIFIPNIDAKSVIVYDYDLDSIIFSKNPDVPTYVASLTKLLTAKMIVDNYELDDFVEIKKEHTYYSGSALNFSEGSLISTYDGIKALLISSNNQVAFAFFDKLNFIEQFEKYKNLLKLKQTNFTNPAGYDDGGNHYSSASDLLKIVKLCLRDPVIRDVIGIRYSFIIDDTSGVKYDLYNTNNLLTNNYSGVIGGKTGTTPMAGENLFLLYQSYNKKTYIVILLNSRQRYIDSYNILRYL